MRSTRMVPGLLAVLALGATSLEAQSCTTNPCTVTNTAQATIGELLELTLAGADPTVLTAPVVTDFNGLGIALKTNTGPQASVRSNVDWTVTVQGNTATFSGGSTTKPASDLMWHPSGTPNAYAQDMSTADVLFSGNATSGVNETILYQTRWDIAVDSPGTYALVVNFTLSAP